MTMGVMMMSCDADVSPGFYETGRFLAEYASYLRGCGATSIRTCRNTLRIAEAYGLEAVVSTDTVVTSLILRDSESGFTGRFSAFPVDAGINFDINASLSALSWNIMDEKIPLEKAVREFRKITSRKYASGWNVLLLTSLANASFCRLFGGDSSAMLIVFLSTAAGCMVKRMLLERRVDVRVVFFIAAYLSALLCCGSLFFNWTATPQVSLATSVLYLIPGVPYINSASDFLSRRYLSSVVRLADALILTAALSAGLCLALFTMNVTMIW